MSQILIERTKKTDKKKKKCHYHFTNRSKLRISIFWFFLKVFQYKKQYKNSNRRFGKLVDMFPHAFPRKFVFIIHSPCYYVYYAYNFLLYLSKLSSKRCFKHNFRLQIHAVFHKTFVILLQQTYMTFTL